MTEKETADVGCHDTTRVAQALLHTIRAIRDELPETPSLWAAYLHTGAWLPKAQVDRAAHHGRTQSTQLDPVMPSGLVEWDLTGSSSPISVGRETPRVGRLVGG